MPCIGMNTTPNDDQPTTDRTGDTGPETWVREAVDQQEEYLKRIRPCGGGTGILSRDGGTPHAFRTFGKKSADGTIHHSTTYQACIVCGVTETDDDYMTMIGTAPR